jgi:hypothetical protein
MTPARTNVDREEFKMAQSMTQDFHPWDFTKFGRGETFINEPLPAGTFDEVFAQVERWGLDQYLKDRNAETLQYPGT